MVSSWRVNGAAMEKDICPSSGRKMARHETENKHLQGQRVGLYSVGVWPRLIKKRSGLCGRLRRLPFWKDDTCQVVFNLEQNSVASRREQ
ncbi:hypothetical protein D5086_018738 [Populus alba]|uniref:Uncharacterized protein n=1 Tax=Populus alba TaxID=43335 RepID=A0ACC4BQI7_POPAL